MLSARDKKRSYIVSILILRGIKMAEIEEYQKELFSEIVEEAEVGGMLTPEAFFKIYSEEVMEGQDISEGIPVYYEREGTPGIPSIRIDGYGGDPIDSDDRTLSIMISEFNQSNSVETMQRQEMEGLFKKAARFVEMSMEDNFVNSLEPTSHAYGLADLIKTRWEHLNKINLFLFTNKSLSLRKDRVDDLEISGKKASVSVWDLNRMHSRSNSSQERAEMTVDFKEDFGRSLPALPANVTEGGYKAYMTIISGTQLAEMYERWGDRLLEYNVRVFLQATGGVNRGIRNTIANNPEMFFAYNNGITATADEINFENEGDFLHVKSVKNLQIVNGGQTTGSLFNAKLNKRDLSKVFVQMKLSIIDSDESETIISNISRYANSQNAVNFADLSANHPFHQRIEEFSRRIGPEPVTGTNRRTRWFYERARGQHKQERAIRSVTDRKKFDLRYPYKKPEIINYPQKFTKTDLAKFANLWNFKPHDVSKGAQKNYGLYFRGIADEEKGTWGKNRDQFNEMFYRNLIAKAIIFRATEKLVSESFWYEPGGPRAQIVNYSISKLAYDVNQMNKQLNFDMIWRAQDIVPSLREALEVSAYETTHQILLKTGKEGQLVGEWAKNQACWQRASRLEIEWPDSLSNVLLDIGAVKEQEKKAKADQKILNGVEAQAAVLKASPEFWTKMRNYGVERSILSERDLSILKITSQVSQTGKMPTDKQCDVLLEAYARLQGEGFPDDIDG